MGTKRQVLDDAIDVILPSLKELMTYPQLLRLVAEKHFICGVDNATEEEIHAYEVCRLAFLELTEVGWIEL